MNQLTDLRKTLATLSSHLTPQANTLLVDTVRNNRLSVELQQWVSILTPENVGALVALVDEQDHQLGDVALHLNSFGVISVSGGTVEFQAKSVAVHAEDKEEDAPVKAIGEIAAEDGGNIALSQEKATSKRTAASKSVK